MVPIVHCYYYEEKKNWCSEHVAKLIDSNSNNSFNRHKVIAIFNFYAAHFPSYLILFTVSYWTSTKINKRKNRLIRPDVLYALVVLQNFT